MNYIELLYVIPLSGIVGWVHTVVTRMNTMRSNTYTKSEVQEMIKLHQEPLKVQIEHIDNNVAEIKTMLAKVLNEKSQTK